ncbi:hypothetical protein TNCV_4590781 [Trichonephila clavipes]|nr:hypothetical protein TNCV_4590781 [Trichonephila clavipes]
MLIRNAVMDVLKPPITCSLEEFFKNNLNFYSRSSHMKYLRELNGPYSDVTRPASRIGVVCKSTSARTSSSTTSETAQALSPDIMDAAILDTASQTRASSMVIEIVTLADRSPSDWLVIVHQPQWFMSFGFVLKRSQRLIEDETFNDSDIINNLLDYEDGQEEPDSLRVDKSMQGSSFFKQIGKAFS